MARMSDVHIAPESLDAFDALLDVEQRRELATVIGETRRALAGRVIWNINSTSRGGGVAEMLQSLLAYARGAGIDARWLVLKGNDPFFRMTKRLHHALHGSRGDGSPLDEQCHRQFEDVALDNAEEYRSVVRREDVVVLHDPQTAALASLFASSGAKVIWRCHVGTDLRNAEVERGWAFLRPYLENVGAAVFSRASYIPPFLEDRSVVIPPSIDVFSPKNEDLDDDAVRAILVHTGLVEGPADCSDRSYRRADGAPGRVDRAADVIRLGRPPTWGTPLIVQVSRWDPLKDPLGVIDGFLELRHRAVQSRPELLLAGPSVHSVADDPEAAATLDTVIERWRGLPAWIRSKIHLACLPMKDVEENAVIVNALQRHAAVVVQKSLQEGFGLTVTEAMWKARPIVASRVGGIADQIRHEVHGVLIDDPRDRSAFADALARMLDDPDFALRCGRRARERVIERFLPTRDLVDFARLITGLGSATDARHAAGRVDEHSLA